MTRPFVVFNAGSRNRRELVEIPTGDEPELVSVAVPACGYSTIDLDAARPSFEAVTVTDRMLENELLRVTWDDDGLLTSVFDKEHRREVLAPDARGNLFQLHDDNPHDFDAWNVDIEYLDHRVDLTDDHLDRDRRARPAARARCASSASSARRGSRRRCGS